MRARIPFGIPIVTNLHDDTAKEADMVYFSQAVYIHDGTSWVPVGLTEIPDGSITTPKLADLAVTAPKIADFAVTNAKLFGNIEPSKLQSQVGFSLIGNSFPGVGLPHVITIGSGLTFVGSELRATGGGGGIPEAPNDGSDYVRNSAGWVLLNWTSLDGKPSTFAPSAHTHPWSDITGTPVTLAGYGITDAAPLSHVGAGGGAHANATISVAGFMSGADKTKLDGVANNANNYVHPNHTGDVTSTGDGTTVIAADAVTNDKLANVSTSTVKGRVTGGVGDPEDLTTAQLTTLVDIFTSVLKGAVPASGGGSTNYLRADGTWAAPVSGFIWSAVAVNTTMVAGNGYLVDCSGGTRNMTLPASVTVGQVFAVNADGGQARIVSNGNVIDSVGPGNDLLINDGGTAYVVGKSTGNLELVMAGFASIAGGSGAARNISANLRSESSPVLVVGTDYTMTITYNMTLNTADSWIIASDDICSVVIDVQRATVASPGVFTSIAASAKPTLTADNYNTGAMTGWSTSLLAGEQIRLRVDSASGTNEVRVAIPAEVT